MDWSSTLRLIGATFTGLLLLLLWSAARPRRGPWWRWVSATLLCVTVAAFLWLLNRWDLSSMHLRLLYPALFAAALLVGLRRRRDGGRSERRSRVRGVLAVVGATASVAFVAILAPVLVSGVGAYAMPDDPIALRSPLRDGRFVVVHGGADESVNHHAVLTSQRHALDIVAVNRAGFSQRFRRRGSLEDYEAFGKPVVAPCAGTVRTAVDGHEDHEPPKRDTEHLAGNHVVLDCGDVLVLLAHLREGSVVPAANDRLEAGDPIGEVGNSGNTTEPHLHVHVVRDPSPKGEESTIDPIDLDAISLPFTIDGEHLVRGSRVPSS